MSNKSLVSSVYKKIEALSGKTIFLDELLNIVYESDVGWPNEHKLVKSIFVTVKGVIDEQSMRKIFMEAVERGNGLQEFKLRGIRSIPELYKNET